ncbi:hypothetical protein [Crocosphaera sp.]|uniref:hypothetical protein n=1 Tax=Crocosphaera sp. TaxID=2729996 RepID=UPI003F2089E5|nr:hypothetical protein [Crocosphaera sp.]
MVSPTENAHKQLQTIENQETSEDSSNQEPVLCPHCKRTASNGIKCKGICVADADY